MVRKFIMAAASLALLATAASAGAEGPQGSTFTQTSQAPDDGEAPQASSTGTYLLQLTVPVLCKIDHKPVGSAAVEGGPVTLGEIDEFCNAPTGYEVIVNYTPGSLRGAVLAAGSDRVVLDGSGEAVLTRASGPKIQNRILTAQAGANGFDTDRLDLRIVPA